MDAARLAFSIDLDRCIGCRACAVACNAGNALAPEDRYVAIADVVRRADGGLWGSFAHRRCFHCADAACVDVCPTGTLTKWSGLTAVDASRCSGCGYCVDACPFGIPQVRGGAVSKCLGCVELAREGEAPWCERTCPSQAIRVGDRAAILADARARAEALRARHPRAQVYGETQAGGLGLVLVLTGAPEAYGLPERPERPPALHAWRAQVKPASLGAAAAAALVMGGVFLVARRQRVAEHEREAGRPDAPGGGGAPGSGGGRG